VPCACALTNCLACASDLQHSCRPSDLKGRKRQSAKDRQACRAAASAQFKERVAAQLLPKLAAFAPDLVIVSAGFDGGQGWCGWVRCGRIIEWVDGQ